MVVFGYLRVSTEKQNVENNKIEILRLAKEKGHDINNLIWISETVSGKKDWNKRKLGDEFYKMKAGDTIIMAEYSRIGRDFLNSMSFIHECRKKNINVFSCVGDIPINSDANSNLMMAVTAWKAQTERELIAYRTKIGLKNAKIKGIKLGRKKEMILDKDPVNVQRVKEDIEKGIMFKNIAKNLKCTPLTLRKFIKKHDLKCS